MPWLYSAKLGSRQASDGQPFNARHWGTVGWRWDRAQCSNNFRFIEVCFDPELFVLIAFVGRHRSRSAKVAHPPAHATFDIIKRSIEVSLICQNPILLWCASGNCTVEKDTLNSSWLNAKACEDCIEGRNIVRVPTSRAARSTARPTASTVECNLATHDSHSRLEQGVTRVFQIIVHLVLPLRTVIIIAPDAALPNRKWQVNR
jgi:hypothetical protein